MQNITSKSTLIGIIKKCTSWAACTCIRHFQDWLLQCITLRPPKRSTAKIATCAECRCPSSHQYKKIRTYHTSLEKSPLASCRTALDVQNSSDHLSGIEVLITTVHQLTHWDLQAIAFWSPVICWIFLGHPKSKRTWGDRAFASAAPHLWTVFPINHLSESVDIFKSKTENTSHGRNIFRVKEHLFRTFNLVSALSILWMEMSARYKYLHYYYKLCGDILKYFCILYHKEHNKTYYCMRTFNCIVYACYVDFRSETWPFRCKLMKTFKQCWPSTMTSVASFTLEVFLKTSPPSTTS